jgi:8-oxo-dGTP pyrophosphatase MutT (NUDIX family)
MDWPDDLPVVERTAVRLVVLDSADRVLLFRIHEPQHPEQGVCWELPGGGMDPGETYVDAALRELWEEAGIRIPAEAVREPTWFRRATFRHAGRRRVQDEAVALVCLPSPGPVVFEGHQLTDERETYLGARWWPLRELAASTQRFYPGRLPDLIRPFVAGERIDEPFEHFS